MDFTIRLRAEGTAETRAQADAVKAVRTELEKTQKRSQSAVYVPRKVREAKEDRELDRAAEKAQREMIKHGREQEKEAQRASALSSKLAAKKEQDEQRASAAKARSAAQDVALSERRVAGEQKASARQAEVDRRRIESERKESAKAEAIKIKGDERKLAQVKRQTEREDRELDRATKKAQRDIIRDEKERAKSSAPAGGGPKGKAGNAKQSLSSLIAVKTVLAQQGVEALKFAAGMAKANFQLALGPMGMARLSMISAQAGFNMKRLFIGTNPKPLLDALQRTGQLIDPRTFTGKALGDLLVRSSNSFFAMLAKAEPYARLFFKGMLLGALQVEGAWLKLRIAIQPALNMFPEGTGLMTAFEAGALAVKGAFGLMGVGIAVGAVKAGAALVSFGASALAATAPLLPFVAAVVALAAAYDQAIKLKAQWDENSSTQIKNKLKEDLGFTTQAERDDAFDRRNKSGKYYVDKTPAPTPEKAAAPLPKGAEKQAASAGSPIGKNLGLGIVAGMKDVQGKVEAGGRDLVLAAEGGAKSAAIIQSPSKKWRKEIGQNLGEGMALGLEDSADRVDGAARATVPSAPVVSVSGATRGGVVIQQIGPFYGMPSGGEQQVRRWVLDALDDAAERVGALA